MVKIHTTGQNFEQIPFESIKIKECNYSELKALEWQLKTQLQELRYEIEKYESNSEHDAEVSQWTESKYLRMLDNAERDSQTEW